MLIMIPHDLGLWIRAGDTDVQRSDAWQTIPKPYGSVPAEELYDLEQDPLEQINLADDAAYTRPLAQMRARLDTMLRQTDSPRLSATNNQPR